MVKTSKINIGIALSQNYNKISLELIEELIEYDNEEQLREKIRTKLKMLREEIEKDFGKDEVKSDIPKNEVEKATDKQTKFLKDLGYTEDLSKLNKIEAQELIKELLNNPKGEDY